MILGIKILVVPSFQNLVEIIGIYREDISVYEKPRYLQIISDENDPILPMKEPAFIDFPFKDVCSKKCDQNEISYSVTAGVAGVIGPKVCWKNALIMSSKVKS